MDRFRRDYLLICHPQAKGCLLKRLGNMLPSLTEMSTELLLVNCSDVTEIEETLHNVQWCLNRMREESKKDCIENALRHNGNNDYELVEKLKNQMYRSIDNGVYIEVLLELMQVPESISEPNDFMLEYVSSKLKEPIAPTKVILLKNSHY